MSHQTLSVSERIMLAQQLWDSVYQHDGEIELTAEQRELLDQRLAAYQADADRGDRWSLVRERIKNTR